jgi:PAS domain S-box-containing protein
MRHLSPRVHVRDRGPEGADDQADDLAGEGHPRGDEIYRLLVDSVQEYAIFALDPSGRIATWNPGAQRLKGYRAEEIRGRHFSVFYPDEDVARGKPATELRIAAEYGRFEDEGWRIRADGTRFWANVNITAIRDPDTGALVGFSKVTRDLTDRRQAEELLRQSEERFRLLVESAEDYAIFMLDAGGHVQSWNRGAQRLKGYRPAEIVGEHFSRFYTPEDLRTGKWQRELATATREGRYEEEGWRVRKDGSRFWASVNLTAMRDPRNGHLLGFSKVTRDLTDRKRAEDALRESYAHMEAFAYTASHDLRAPLRAVYNLADATLEEHGAQLPPEARANVAAMMESARKAAKLAEDLLRFARGARADLRRERVDLAALAREIAASLNARLACPVELRVPPGADLVVEGDPDLLRVVVENLLSNAWKYTGRTPAPVAELTAAGIDPEGRRVVRLHDNGVGFDPRRAADLFQPFRRLHAEKEYVGSGVGLATVRRIVERHGGRTWAESKAGEGASFFLALPLPPPLPGESG